MKVGLKLFDKNNKVVNYWAEAPASIGGAAMVQYEGTFYSYRSIFGNDSGPGRIVGAYARFDECSPPVVLEG